MQAIILAVNWEFELRGILTVMIGTVVWMGSVYLILGTNVGARLGFMIALTGLAGWMALMGGVWWIYGIGLKGDVPEWKQVPGQTVIQEVDLLYQAGVLDDPIDVTSETDPNIASEAVAAQLAAQGWTVVESSAPEFGQAEASAKTQVEHPGAAQRILSAPQGPQGAHLERRQGLGRAASARIAQARVGAGGKQAARDHQLGTRGAATHQQMQRCVARDVDGVRIGAGVEQQCHRRRVAALGGVMQSTAACQMRPRVGRREIARLLEVGPQALQVPAGGGVDERTRQRAVERTGDAGWVAEFGPGCVRQRVGEGCRRNCQQCNGDQAGRHRRPGPPVGAGVVCSVFHCCTVSGRDRF